MADAMKIYSVEIKFNRSPKEILSILKRAFQDLCTSPVIGWVPPPRYDSAHHQFLRGKEGIYWARIFYDPITPVHVECLVKESHEILRDVKQKITLFTFFPSVAPGSFNGLNFPEAGVALPFSKEQMRFFEYCFLWSQDQQGLALKEWWPFVQQRKAVHIEAPGPGSLPVSQHADFHFFKQARLSRNELAELMDLVMEVQKA